MRRCCIPPSVMSKKVLELVRYGWVLGSKFTYRGLPDSGRMVGAIVMTELG